MAEGSQAQLRLSVGERLRRAALFFLFSAVLLIPRTLSWRRRRGLWNGLRLAAAAAGAYFAGTAKGGWLGATVGVALLLLALLARPARGGKTVNEQARELGALVVLNGGRCRTSNGKFTAVRLFVAPGRIHALDLSHRPVLEIPLAAVSVLRVEQAAEGWRLRAEWEQAAAEFYYDGVFAEHLARVAETTLRSRLRRELPVLR